MTQSKQQDKIQEIMVLVDEHHKCGVQKAEWLRSQIESKLRELVRDPLELGVVDKEYSDKWSFFDSEYEAFVGGVRYAESAHGITSASGEE